MNKALVVKDSVYFKKGMIIDSFKELKEGIEVNGNFLPKTQVILLNESLSVADEKRIRDIIRQQLKLIFWNLYTKNSVIIGNL